MINLDEESTMIMRLQWRRALVRVVALLDDETFSLENLLHTAHLVGTVGLEMTRTAGYAVSDAAQQKRDQNQRESEEERRDLWHG